MPSTPILSSWLRLPPTEQRSESQIDAEIEDEFAFHIDQIAHEFVESGIDTAEAQSLALARFGNLSVIHNQCKRIALKERNMLQRVNFAMMLLVFVGLITIGIQLWTTQKQNAAALQAITTEINHMRYDAEHSPNPQSRPVGLVYMDGDVARPGAYNLPQYGALTLRRFIASAGGVTNNADAMVMVTSIDQTGQSRLKFKLESLADATETDYMLGPDDHVQVIQIGSAQATQSALPASGE